MSDRDEAPVDVPVEGPVEPMPEAATELPVEARDDEPGLDLPELVPGEGEGASLPLGALEGIGLELSAVIGRRRLELRELLKVRAGTVIELESLQGDPIDLVVDGRCIARAEVVVVDGKIGARILELAPNHD